jgi:hypothetical protein
MIIDETNRDGRLHSRYETYRHVNAGFRDDK